MLRRLVILALLLPAGLPVAAAGTRVTGGGALQAKAEVDMRVVIPYVLELKLLDQPSVVTIDADQAARGEVVVSGGRVALLANDRRGYVVEARLDGPFVEAVIDGLDAPIRVTPDGARVLMPSMVGLRKPGPYRMRCRLRLQEGTAPGVYRWPVTLAIEAP